jgi:zinc protease
MQGSEADIVAFLNGVCASLRDLPMDRLTVEKGLLEAEAGGHGLNAMALWRHGARDFGLTGYPEQGLPAVTPDDLGAWVARFFTNENAVLWVAGDSVPEGLRLDLPSGIRQPVPALSSALPRTPAYFCVDPADVTAVINQRVEALQQADGLAVRLPGQAINLCPAARCRTWTR